MLPALLVAIRRFALTQILFSHPPLGVFNMHLLKFSLASSLVLGTALVTAAPVASGTVKEIYRFPNATRIENVHRTRGGKLLLNTFDSGRIFIIDPSAPNPEAYLLAEIPTVDQITGIDEVAPNVFAVSGGIGHPEIPFSFVEGSALVATVEIDPYSVKAPIVKVVARAPDALLLNGLAALPHAPSTVLSIDSIGGRIFRTNIKTGDIDVAFQDDLFTYGPEPQLIPLGGNGIVYQKGYLYFTNTEEQLFGRVKVTAKGDRAGEIEEIFRLPEGNFGIFDDFALSKKGVAYVTTHWDSLTAVTLDGESTVLIGPDTHDVVLESPTSAVLSKDEKTLYIVTGGLDGAGGQVVSLRL